MQETVIEAEDFLTQTLGNDCEGQESHERVEDILMALKAIGNAKRPTNLFDTIFRCARKGIHANITRAAFDAIRGFPCFVPRTTLLEHRSRELLQIAENTDVDPEVRIHAVIALIRCPSNIIIERLINTLEVESSNQVASFIWSHLTNVMESSDPKNKV